MAIRQNNDQVARDLSQVLRRTVPNGRVSLQTLPEASPIRLWLADPETFGVRYDDEVVNQIMQSPPYWSFCWASGQVIARSLLANPALVAGKSVVDFGCGSAVVAIAACLAGARRVWACDLDPDALAAATANAGSNGVSIEPVASLAALDEIPDLLFAADILYDPDNRPLVQWLRAKARQVCIADSRIKDFSAPGFRHEATDYAVTFPDMGELDQFNQVRLFWARDSRCPITDKAATR